MINITIGGDICPIGRNLPYFISGDAKGIFDGFLDDFRNADMAIVNLECPLIIKKTPIYKAGPVLGVPSDCINGLKAAEINIVNMANNHILDHGPEGLENTLKVCKEAGISTVGAGKNLKEAKKILIKKIGKIRIAILSVAEHEFSIATENSYGANPLDLISFVIEVQKNKELFDYLIVLLHGGNEFYPYPSPRLKNICHFMIDQGAKLVIVQHTHCPGSYEDYREGHIIYGQGNLIFDMPEENKVFFEGFLIKMTLNNDRESKMDIIPYRQSDSKAGARKMEGEYKRSFYQALNERSNAIKDDSYLQNQWIKFCESRKKDYLNRILCSNRLLQRLSAHRFFFKLLYPRKSLLKLQNTISCEAHREVLETLFKYHLI